MSAAGSPESPEVEDVLRELLRGWREWRNNGDALASAAVQLADLARECWRLADVELNAAEEIARGVPGAMHDADMPERAQ